MSSPPSSPFRPSSYLPLLNPDLSIEIVSPLPTIRPINELRELEDENNENEFENVKVRKRLTRQKNTEEEHIVTPVILKKGEKVEKKLAELFDRKKKERSNETLTYITFFVLL